MENQNGEIFQLLHRSHTKEPSGQEEEINFSATAAENDRRRPDSSAPHLFPSSLNYHISHSRLCRHQLC